MHMYPPRKGKEMGREEVGKKEGGENRRNFILLFTVP